MATMDTATYEQTLKPASVETPLDLLFFRPAGYAVAKALLPTRVTPNQVTLASIATGLLSAWLSASPRRGVRVLGGALGVAYGVLDCADGQLARARGTSSRVGRILDGASDYIVGCATGLAIGKELARKHPQGAWLAALGVGSVVLQGTLFDHCKNRFLSLTRNDYREGDDLRETEDDLERLRATGGPRWERSLLTVYATFLRAQSSIAGHRHETDMPHANADQARELGRLARAWAWLGPSTHVAVLCGFTLADRVDLYVWLRLTLGNAAAMELLRRFRAVERDIRQGKRQP